MANGAEDPYDRAVLEILSQVFAGPIGWAGPAPHSNTTMELALMHFSCTFFHLGTPRIALLKWWSSHNFSARMQEWNWDGNGWNWKHIFFSLHSGVLSSILTLISSQNSKWFQQEFSYSSTEKWDLLTRRRSLWSAAAAVLIRSCETASLPREIIERIKQGASDCLIFVKIS